MKVYGNGNEADVYDVYDASEDEELNDGSPYVAINAQDAGLEIEDGALIKDELSYDDEGDVYDKKGKKLGKIAKFMFNPLGAGIKMGKQFLARKKQMKKMKKNRQHATQSTQAASSAQQYSQVNTTPIAGAGTVLDGVLDAAMDRMVRTGKIIMPLDPDACDIIFTSNALLHKYESKADILKAMDAAVQGANNKSFLSTPYAAPGIVVTIPIAPAVNTMAACKIRFSDSLLEANYRGIPCQVSGSGVDPVDFVIKPKKNFFEVLLLGVSLAQGFANIRPCTKFDLTLGAGVARVGSNWELESINARDLGTKRS